MDTTTKMLFAVFLSIIKQESPELLNLENYPSEITSTDLLEKYDFIIVGAGSAGSVVASRLSEVKDWKILLIESGEDENIYSKTPLFQKIHENKYYTWEYSTVFQENACQATKGICIYPMGKIMGGSGSINGMLYARGSKHDYNEWEEMGCYNWTYNEVLPYFIKSENVKIPTLMGSRFHGTKGPLVVQHSKYLPDLTSLLIKAAQEVGIPKRDYNGEYLTAADIPQVNIDDFQRCSPSTAYLVPARNRPNLHILKASTVNKVLIDKSTRNAVGVEFESNKIVKTVLAKKEVILSAGAINSPKILMLSGIGPKESLEKIGIDILSNRPVGKNFHDHVYAYFRIKMEGNFSITKNQYLDSNKIREYARNKKGEFTYNGFPAMIFFSLGKDIAKDPPDIQIHVLDFHKEPRNHSELLFLINKTKPKSRGTVTLKNSDPKEPPLIDPKYFSVNEDIEDTVEGFKVALKIINSNAFVKYRPQLDQMTYCSNLTDEKTFLKCMVKYYSGTVFHPVGTVSMGPRDNPDSVVDPELRVIGVNKLRVIDASIMPNIIRANTNAPTIMIAEKASDVIKKDYNLF